MTFLQHGQVNREEDSFSHVDIDKEVLEGLETLMFSYSIRLGLAGAFQWGLDAGHYQYNWDPYCGGHWSELDLEEAYDDFESLVVCPPI